MSVGMDKHMERWAGILVVAAIVLILLRREHRTRLRLVEDASGNEALVVRTHGGVESGVSSFLVDTAYAGAPVISLSYLALLKRTPSLRHACPRRAYEHVATAVAPSEEEMERALQDLLRNGRSRTFTSGCTMRLVSIGAVAETHSDMLLAPALSVGGRRDGDVFVTNPLHRSFHILTADYLLHRAPTLLCPSSGKLVFRAAPVDVGVGMRYVDVELVGGAPCVAMDVEGESLRLVLDTGAAAPVSLHRGASRLREPTDGARRATQLGVNGERVCSQVHHGDVTFAGITQRNVDVLVSDSQPMGVDGYVGMAFLRAFDLLIAPRKLGVRASGLPVKRCASTSAGACAAAPRGA